MFDKGLEMQVFSTEDIDEFELLIFAIGYETRSRYIAESLAGRFKFAFAYVFSDHNELSFSDNLRFANDIGAETFSDASKLSQSLSALPFLPREKVTFDGARIIVDVSSMSRTVLSQIISQLLDDEIFEGAHIGFVYAAAEYTKPCSLDYDFLDFQPMSEFSGWTSAPEKPLAMILGLGYEVDHALGAVEYLDPSATFCFYPKGHDERYAAEVEKANGPLLTQLKSSRIIKYPVADPLHTFSLLSSIIQPLREAVRFVLVPMGPKIFVALCLVCQRLFGEEVSVWRASGHSHSPIKDAKAEGPITGFWIRRNAS